MKKKGQWSCRWPTVWFGIVLQSFLLTQFAAAKQNLTKKNSNDQESYPPVRLNKQANQVVMDNGLVNITLSVPNGEVVKIQYNGIANLLQENKDDNRGYWDVVWNYPQTEGNIYDKLEGTNFTVIKEDESQVELSFTKTYDSSSNSTQLPLNFDKRFILLRGSTGFYTYGILERLHGYPDADVFQGRTVFKLHEKLFTFMSISDERKRIMPTAEDRARGRVLAFPEAVLLTDPSNPYLQGEVDDKYQYSCANSKCRVHGWICSSPPTGFWMITPSIEFKTGGPVKQDLTSHVGPTTLSMYFSTHYAGEKLGLPFRNGEAWKKVFGPVFIYLNSVSPGVNPLEMWLDAKEKLTLETQSWPYDFVTSQDYPSAENRGRVSGRLLVLDRYIDKDDLITGNSSYVGLAAPGDAGSWQIETKGYQFWTQADEEGNFIIDHVRPGNYSLYAWVPGFIGDYRYNDTINIRPGEDITLGDVVYEPPRNGPTIWEIGTPDRTAMEFYVPDANPELMNHLYVLDQPQKYRQYGLWDRYSDLYPFQDLIFTVGVDSDRKDWFFAHVNRRAGNGTYVPTTWQIIFDLQNIDSSANYTLQLALASATDAELQVRVNNPDPHASHFTTGSIGKDNSIARHGIHGLYWLYSIQIPGSQLCSNKNTIYLTQRRGGSPWKGLMYDYIRLEGPPDKSQ